MLAAPLKSLTVLLLKFLLLVAGPVGIVARPRPWFRRRRKSPKFTFLFRPILLQSRGPMFMLTLKSLAPITWRRSILIVFMPRLRFPAGMIRVIGTLQSVRLSAWRTVTRIRLFMPFLTFRVVLLMLLIFRRRPLLPAQRMRPPRVMVMLFQLLVKIVFRTPSRLRSNRAVMTGPGCRPNVYFASVVWTVRDLVPLELHSGGISFSNVGSRQRDLLRSV